MSNKERMEDARLNARIAISGKSGCGNSTVSKLVSVKLALRFINFTFRNLAAEKGMELKKILELAAEDDSWDKEIDRRQVALAREEGGCVLGSRLAIWMLPEANLKVYLTASAQNRASRIQKREGGGLKDIAAFTASRDRQDRERYIRIYNIDNDDFSTADLVIDTDDKDPEEISRIIVEELDKKLSR